MLKHHMTRVPARADRASLAGPPAHLSLHKRWGLPPVTAVATDVHQALSFELDFAIPPFFTGIRLICLGSSAGSWSCVSSWIRRRFGGGGSSQDSSLDKIATDDARLNSACAASRSNSAGMVPGPGIGALQGNGRLNPATGAAEDASGCTPALAAGAAEDASGCTPALAAGAAEDTSGRTVVLVLPPENRGSGHDCDLEVARKVLVEGPDDCVKSPGRFDP